MVKRTRDSCMTFANFRLMSGGFFSKFRFTFRKIFSIIQNLFLGNRQFPIDMAEEVMYEQESQGSKFSRKAKETPFFPIAIAACTIVVGYGIYAFKNKGKMSTSVYLMQLRVGAQGAAVGSLTLGLAYTMWKQHLERKSEAANSTTTTAK